MKKIVQKEKQENQSTRKTWCKLPIPDGQRYKACKMVEEKGCPECYKEWWDNFRERNRV